MASEIEEKIKKIEAEKEKIRLKEKLIKEHEKRQRSKNFVEIGRIAGKAGIDSLDKEILLGAFIEIAQNYQDEKYKTAWKEKAINFLKGQNVSKETPLSICFSSAPSKEIKDKLKSLGFRWNSFRKEFLGYADESALQEILVESEYKIEVLD